MKSSTINIFDSYNELKKNAKKEFATTSGYMNPGHYRLEQVQYKGGRNGAFLVGTDAETGVVRYNSHGRHKYVRDDYSEACHMQQENLKRYVELYNERHDLMNVDELRHISLWLDYNHEGLNGYHGVDTNTKYCGLHLKDEKPYLYMGIELEVTWDDEVVDGYNGDRYDEYGDYDEYGEYDEYGDYIPDKYDFDIRNIVKKALKIGKGLFTAEEDGSLYMGYSAEFVSRPLSPRAWHSEQVVSILKELTDYLKSTGAMVEQPSGNGFHIHVSKKFFEANPACNRPVNEVARDMNWVFQKFQDEIEVIGGREYNEWCASMKMNIKSSLASSYGVVIDKAHIDKAVLALPYGDHRKAFIDSASGYTFEARVFHSTLDVERILACIEFMRNVSHGARENALDGKTFGQITRYKDAPNLKAVIERVKSDKKLKLGKRNTKTLELELA